MELLELSLPLNQIVQADALTTLQQFEANTIDLLVTDPPYALTSGSYNENKKGGFMNKEWDAKLVSVETWRECLRVLKPGAFAFIMSSPRQDVLSRMIVNLQDAGFRTDFTSIYWTYASGFPKAANISKLIDKREGAEREIIGYTNPFPDGGKRTNYGMSGKGGMWEGKGGLERGNTDNHGIETKDGMIPITKGSTDQAKALDGAYGGFQPKPAVEIILTVMKPLSEKSFTDQALANGKGVTWLDSVRIPYQNENDRESTKIGYSSVLPPEKGWNDNHMSNPVSKMDLKGRFPANLLVSDDVLNDGSNHKSGKMKAGIRRSNLQGYTADMPQHTLNETIGDSGSYSRYFSLDKWFETTFPFAIIPKASKAEKNRGLDQWMPTTVNDGRQTPIDNPFQRGETPRRNTHATVKPIKLMSYLIMLGSRPNDIILDPFCGSGTTCIAAQQLKRQWIGIDNNKEYAEIANARIKSVVVHKATNFFL